MRSDFENFGPFIDTDLAPPKNSSGANDVIAIDHVLQPRSQGLSSYLDSLGYNITIQYCSYNIFDTFNILTKQSTTIGSFFSKNIIYNSLA